MSYRVKALIFMAGITLPPLAIAFLIDAFLWKGGPVPKWVGNAGAMYVLIWAVMMFQAVGILISPPKTGDTPTPPRSQ